jgi:hypothetical protein
MDGPCILGVGHGASPLFKHSGASSNLTEPEIAQLRQESEAGLRFAAKSESGRALVSCEFVGARGIQGRFSATPNAG